ncbi:hypothetical protein [Moheibacter stercoris]|uniref:Uncharacterized protein n=1 Tax=Moheibacter stercoris TaxID=1628251 RepID=A0ABV2LQ13_9FLAO
MKYSTKYKINESVSITLIMTIIFLIVNLLIEIVSLDQFKSLGFSRGYLFINDNKIGYHLFAYIFSMIISFFILFKSTKTIS